MAGDVTDQIAVAAAKEVTDHFLEHGVLGLLSLVMTMAAIFFYREMKKAEGRERSLLERYVTKSEFWVDRYNEVVREMKNVIEAFARRAT